MDWQQLVSLTIVGATAALLVRSKLRRPKFNFARIPHCGCASRRQAPPPYSIIYHARKGERPRITVKMK